MIVFVWTEIKIYVYYRLRLQSSSCGRSLTHVFNHYESEVMKTICPVSRHRVSRAEVVVVDVYFFLNFGYFKEG